MPTKKPRKAGAKPAPKKDGKPAGRKPAAKPSRKSSRKPLKPVPVESFANREGYGSFRDSQAAVSRERSAVGREIGPLPDCVDPDRREACRLDLDLFGTTYFAQKLFWPRSRSQLDDVATLRRCVLDGGLFAYARPRGEGKTTDAEIAALWATFYGHRRYALLIAANERPLASGILESLRQEIEQNDLLLEDFPEVCYPVRRLEGIVQRANGQTIGGVRCRLEFTREGIRFPFVIDPSTGKPFPGSGTIIEAVGMTAAIRGRKARGADGGSVRPDIVLLDDPQTRDSAKSPTQTTDRIATIRGDVLGLAGPDTSIAVAMPCTVIYPHDLADQLLDREKFPQWQGRRTKRLVSWPANMDLWDEYARVRAAGLRDGDSGAAGNAFYLANREELDRGAAVTWEARVKNGEVSAIQGAMNRWIDDPREFAAEDQNEPLTDSIGAGGKFLSAEAVAARTNGYDRLMVPDQCARLTAFVDVGGHLLWWGVAAWNESFGGALIDYGAWPRQSRATFAASDPRPSLTDVFPGMTEPQRIFAGLNALTGEILGRTYYRAGGGELRIERCLVDSGDQSKTVYEFVRKSPHSAIIYPSIGTARTTTKTGVSEWKLRPGERSGYHWKLSPGEERRTQRAVFDADSWKTFLHTALTAPQDGTNGLTLWGKSAGAHEQFGQHCTAEQSSSMTIRGVTFDKWTQLPHRPDNHLLDVAVGCAVAASVAGVQWSASGRPEPVKAARPKLKLSEIQARKRAAAPVR